MSPLRRLWNTIRRARMDEDLRQELDTHLALIEEEERAQGLTTEQARYRAKARFGSPLTYRERTTDAVAVTWLADVGKDVRFAARSLARTPGFTAVALLTLALGIGANTALFSIFSSLILRPLPVRDPGSLALLTNGSWSYPIWEEIRARETELFDGAVAWSSQRFDLSPSGQSDLVDGAYVSGRLFDVLGVTAIRGRMITPADDGGAAPDGPVAVVSHRLWRQRFTGALASLLPGVGPADGLTVAIAPALLGAMGMLAALLAATRVLRADPAATLRSE